MESNHGYQRIPGCSYQWECFHARFSPIAGARESSDRTATCVSANPEPTPAEGPDGSNRVPGNLGHPNSSAKSGRSFRVFRLIAALVSAAVLSVGGLHFWNYLHSYQWTDDAEIDGHLDPISTRIDGTVVKVYVEDTRSEERRVGKEGRSRWSP